MRPTFAELVIAATILGLVTADAQEARRYVPIPLPRATRQKPEPAPEWPKLTLDVPPPPKEECRDGACEVTPPKGPPVSIAPPDLVLAGDLVTPDRVNDRTVHHAGLWWYRQSNPGDAPRWLVQAAPGATTWKQHQEPKPLQPAQPAAQNCPGGTCPAPAVEFWAPARRRR